MEEGIIDTSGFYKNNKGNLLFGPNRVWCNQYKLIRHNKNEYTYPIDGWYWFDSEEEAKVLFNL